MTEIKTGFDLPTMKTLWLPRLLGFINCLPSTICVFLFYMLPMMIANSARALLCRTYLG